MTYALSPNRQRPLAGAARNAVFNTFRRTSHQIGYWLPPILIAYYAMHWATERYGIALGNGKNDRDKETNAHDRNEYLNSKAGRAEFGDEE